MFRCYQWRSAFNVLARVTAPRLYIKVSFHLHLIGVSFNAIIVNEMQTYIAIHFVTIRNLVAISIPTKKFHAKNVQNCWL